MGSDLKRKKRLKQRDRSKKTLALKLEARMRELRSKILTWDAPELKQEAKQNDSFEYNKEVVDELKEVLDATENGVGIAATQIGNMSRVFITRPDFPKDNKVNVFINPVITSYGNKKEKDKEGCLSYPEHYCEVERSDNISIDYIDEKGKEQSQSFTGWHARVIQHEYDHLNGVCLVGEDYYESKKS